MKTVTAKECIQRIINENMLAYISERVHNPGIIQRIQRRVRRFIIMKKHIIAALLLTVFALTLMPAANQANAASPAAPAIGAALPVVNLTNTAAPAANLANTTTLASQQEIRIFIDGRQITTDVAPRIVDDRTLVPISVIAQTLGAAVDWNNDERSVTIRRAYKEIVLFIDNEYATVNGESIKLDVAPRIINDRTFLPVRFVAEQLAQKVGWENDERIVTITDDMSFAYEDSNIKAWMLGCGAILAAYDKNDPYCIGMNYRSVDNAASARRTLSGSWGCDDRVDLISTIYSMIDNGHAEGFAYDAFVANSLSDEDFEYRLSISSPTDVYMWRLVKALSEKWGDKGVKAWDWFRMSHLAGWGYLAGYLELEEVYILVEAIAQRLQSLFSSWEEATDNYMDGYAWWSRTDVSQEGTVYKQRLQIYEDLKAAQETKGLLFDPDVWTQPVRGVIAEPEE